MNGQAWALLVGLTMAHGASAADAVQVDIRDFMFSPAQLTISAGTQVTWVNDDQIPHTLVDTGKRFRSAALDTQDRFTHTFDTPGRYEYFCTLHPQMVGTLIVTARP